MWTTESCEWHEPIFVLSLYILKAHLPLHRKWWGFMFCPFMFWPSTSSVNIRALSPYCLDILELFQFFGCKCSFSLFFSWALQNSIHSFQNTVLFIYSHSPLKFGSELTFSIFYSRNPFLTSQVWVGFSFRVLLFHSLPLYPCNDLLMCVCV